MRALFSGVTGIRSHQVRMDVIGNNIANVNTVGFKSSRVLFQDVFSQVLSTGSAQTTPQQIGLGVAVATTDVDHGIGSFQLTGRPLDLAIEGGGMFVMRGADGQNSYTRVGNFDWDADGFLVNPGTGQRVQGWLAGSDGAVDAITAATMGDLRIPRGATTVAQPTSFAELAGNLNAGAAINTTAETTLTAYDSLGRAHTLTLTFTKVGENTWSWTADGPNGSAPGSGVLQFGTDGRLDPNFDSTGRISLSIPGAEFQDIDLDFADLTQAYSGQNDSSVRVRKADGYPMGVLESVSIDGNGQVIGVFSNGFRRPMAQLAMATFSNPAGLLKSGSTNFAESISSGAPMIGTPNTAGFGRLVAGNLEMSNVDLSVEFTNMIMTQRGFQANTRIISASDEMLQDVVNLRR